MSTLLAWCLPCSTSQALRQAADTAFQTGSQPCLSCPPHDPLAAPHLMIQCSPEHRLPQSPGSHALFLLLSPVGCSGCAAICH